ncbi:MAG: hypothetical protein Q9195_008573 [Heterodermia aff. obscurata]
MRICIFQSSGENGQTGSTQPANDTYTDPSKFTEQHIFERRWITESSVEEQIGAALAEKFDMYWTLPRGRQVNETTELKVANCLESLNIPFIGASSHALGKLVPEEQNPDNDDKGLETASRHMWRFAKPLLIFPQAGSGQDHMNGNEYLVLVVAMGSTATSILPERPHTHSCAQEEAGERLDGKLSTAIAHQTRFEIYPALQKAAVEAYEVAQMQGCPWCTVKIRVRSDGALGVVGIDPRPDLFSSKVQTWEDATIERGFPGGHGALVNCAIVTCQMRYGIRKKFDHAVEEVYASWSQRYDGAVETTPGVALHMCKFDLRGSILDLGSGTGRFGKVLQASRESEASFSRDNSLIGIDISPHMAEIGKRQGIYQDIRVGSIQEVLPTMPLFDHIVSLSALYHLSPLEISFVLSSAFLKARKSITFGIDELSTTYNEAVRKFGPPYDAMEGQNNVEQMKSYAVPRGWSLVDETRLFGWKSPNTGVEIYTTVYRFEHDLSEL